MRSIWWIRRDIRLTDNLALLAALKESEEILPVFILDPALVHPANIKSKKINFLFSCLDALDRQLKQRNSQLIIRPGRPPEELAWLVDQTGAMKIYATADHSYYARKRDEPLKAMLPLVEVDSPAYLSPGSILNSSGSPYTVFTPFSKAWKSLANIHPPEPAPGEIPFPKSAANLSTFDLAGLFQEDFHFPAGEISAQHRLDSFVKADPQSQAQIYRYKEERNRLDLNGTSGLSPYLRFGLLSPRQVFFSAFQAKESASSTAERENAEVWINELIWREFYIHIQFHFPGNRNQNFKNIKVRWINHPDDFQAWCSGLTGYPVVDAAMRQLNQTGWMHNRARMIAASFLTKDLLVDWKMGEKYFMEKLIDGDPASNNGGWQWVAGTGTDAAPYFRIFNPVLQGKKFDPQGSYIRRWIPELQEYPDEYIHEPWLAPISIQRNAHCVVGVDYPHPIIDHLFARERVLQAYGSA
jgi:deoxyribodipyrimidine photo-lyase